ncbi:hypothetical protein [Roseomonas populi]|uniref:Secreted protein n=1 Tax=Roseomonas populi TaxID=3121582 RepID=A0ABT1X9R6_9PROT|nr:hypothetical protein [Roseomonas pecuniae]MCR0984444.1 hypothetical protein [Roseomonas pecuniae]
MRQTYGCALAICGIFGHVLAGMPALAAPAPDLASTALYARTVQGCRAIDLATWRHPVREVLRAARARVVKAELCNGRRFPVLTVVLPYAVDGDTDRYFSRLYASLAEANGFWPFALVDMANGVVITVEIDRASRTVSPAYEDFRVPDGAAR